MQYRLEQESTRSPKNAIDGEKGEYGFTVEQVSFSPWQTQGGPGWWTQDYWLVTSEVEAPNYREAWGVFIRNIVRIVPRMTLVSQCYMEHLGQPILIKRSDSDAAFIWWVLNRQPVGLMFIFGKPSPPPSVALTDTVARKTCRQ